MSKKKLELALKSLRNVWSMTPDDSFYRMENMVRHQLGRLSRVERADLQDTCEWIWCMVDER